MIDTYKNLGQSVPAANTLTNAYTVGAASSAVVSTIVVCNFGTVDAMFRISHALAGAEDATAQYLFYDVTIKARATQGFTFGPTLATTDVIRVQSSTGYVAFNIYGVEVT